MYFVNTNFFLEVFLNYSSNVGKLPNSSSINTVFMPSTPFNAMDCRVCVTPGSSVHGILQARILEWVAMPFSRGSSPPRNLTPVS